MIYKLFILMLLCHVIDDFVFQPICLSKLKKKEWWVNNVFIDSTNEGDYHMAMLIHCISWSAMIHLPLLIFLNCSGTVIFISFGINVLIHYIVDELNVNQKEINLTTDQSIHFGQVFLTLIINFLLI